MLLLLLIGIGVYFRFGRSTGGGDPEEYRSAYQGLCETEKAVATNLNHARDVFYVKSHSTLHVLAAELTDEDTPLAARLLEAKNRVEADLGGTSIPQAQSSMRALLVATQHGLDFLDVSVEPCAS